MAEEVTASEHEALLGYLAAVYDEMDHHDLKRALGAMTDIAEEFAVELVNQGVAPARVLHGLRTGIGRLHVTAPLPTDHSSIGTAPARRLAALVARTRLWGHLANGCEDDAALDAFTDDCDDEQEALKRCSRGQLLLVRATLEEFSDRLRAAGAPRPPITAPGGGSTVEQSLWSINWWASVIGGQSQTLHARTGSMDVVWALHREFFN